MRQRPHFRRKRRHVDLVRLRPVERVEEQDRHRDRSGEHQRRPGHLPKPGAERQAAVQNGPKQCRPAHHEAGHLDGGRHADENAAGDDHADRYLSFPRTAV